MSEDKKGQSGGRRRRRRRRSGKKNSGSRNSSNRSKNKRSGRSGGRRSGGRRSGKRSGNRSGNRSSGRNKSKRLKFGGREPVAEFERRSEAPKLTPFELFCSYYLGITEDNRYRKPSMGQTAKLFNLQPEDIELALRTCGMDKHTLRDVDFDMSLAQLDIRVAPDGIDKREIARPLFDEFMEANAHFVDLEPQEIAEDADIELPD